MSPMRPGQPLALYMAGAFANHTGKMGLGILRYGEHPVAAMIEPELAGRSVAEVTGIASDAPIVATLAEAKACGAEVLVLGIAPPGGEIPADWWPVLDEAVALGFHILNGLHEPLNPRYPNRAQDQWIWDVRTEPAGLKPATGAARELKAARVLTVGTDMSVGKMTASLELHAALRRRGRISAFVATGQTGMAISGRGVPLDAIRVDFSAGAIEREVMAAAESEVIVVEGQGSLINPASTATLALIRGSVPSHLLMVHRAGMHTLPRHPWVHVPDLRRLAQAYEDLAEAAGAFPRPQTIGVALNTAHLDDAAALTACEEISLHTGWPCVDPVRHGADALAALLS